MNELVLSPENSTTGRAYWSTALFPKIFQILPSASAWLLTRQFFRPWRRIRGLDTSSANIVLPIAVAGRTVRVGLWGTGPLIVLAHGWAGSGAQLDALRERLLRRGYCVAAFDAPAHGSSRGSSANVGQFASVIQELARRLGPPHAVIGHSLGGMAAALAQARGVSVAGMALLAPLPSFDFALDEFQRVLSFPDGIRETIARSVESIVGVTRAEGHLPTLLAGRTPTLVVHDAVDRRVPIAYSRRLAARTRNVRLLETSGLGHRGILTDESVSEAVERFIDGLPAPDATPIDRSLAALPEFRF